MCRPPGQCRDDLTRGGNDIVDDIPHPPSNVVGDIARGLDDIVDDIAPV